MDTRIDQPILSKKMLRRFARFAFDRRMRRAAAALESGNYSDLSDMDYYLELLDSPVGVRLKHRLLAAEALRFANLTSEQQIRVEAISRAIVSKRHVAPLGNFFLRTFNIAWRYIACIGIAYWYEMVVLTEYTNGNLLAFLSFLATALLITIVVPPWSIVADERKYRSLREVSAALLGAYGNPASIETLLAAKQDGKVWRYAGPSLFHVLNRLTLEDYGKISPTGVKLLTGALHPFVLERDLDVWIPLIFNSIEKVGTGACVAAVQRIAGNSSVPERREHAIRVLPILIERQRLETDSGRLLRAMDAEQRSDSLLRPIETGHMQEVKNLLQPASQPLNSVLTAKSESHG